MDSTGALLVVMLEVVLVASAGKVFDRLLSIFSFFFFLTSATKRKEVRERSDGLFQLTTNLAE